MLHELHENAVHWSLNRAALRWVRRITQRKPTDFAWLFMRAEFNDCI